MKKYRQLIIGFILGAFIFSVFPVGAAIQEFVCTKANYKVMINGVVYTNPDLPILNYKGNTYAPFKSMLESAGLNVTWNSELSQAEVISNQTTSNNTISKEETTMTTTTKPTSTPDGITQIDEWEGKYYIGFLYIDNKCKETGYRFQQNIKLKKWQLLKDEIVIIDDVPISLIYGHSSVEYNYYISSIMPIISAEN